MRLKIEKNHSQYTMKGKNCFILVWSQYVFRKANCQSLIEIVLTVFFIIIATTYWMPTVTWGYTPHVIPIREELARVVQDSGRVPWEAATVKSEGRPLQSMSMSSQPQYLPCSPHWFNPDRTHKCFYRMEMMSATRLNPSLPKSALS